MTTMPVPTSDTKCYDNTRVSEYKTCPRKFFIRHELGWRPTGTGAALVFGSSWHNGQDIIWGWGKKFDKEDLAGLAYQAFVKTWTDEGFPEYPTLEQAGYMAPRTPQIAYEMINNYIDTRWKMIQLTDVVAIEQPFAVPIPDMPGHFYIGKLDKVVDYNGQRLILEHKSTTAYATIGNFRTDYVESWFMSAQVKGYEFGGSLYYGNVDAIWVDAALVHKKVHNAFKFIPVSHNFVLLQEWLDGTKAWIKQISAEQDMYHSVKKLLPGMFKKNEESCFGKYGACPYIDICRTQADPSVLEEAPPGFVKDIWEPFSILGLDKLIKENKVEAENGTQD